MLSSQFERDYSNPSTVNLETAFLRTDFSRNFDLKLWSKWIIVRLLCVFMASRDFAKKQRNRICATNSDRVCTHCTGRAGGTVQLLGGVLLFFWQRGHGGVQWGAWAGVGENKRSLSSTGGVTGVLGVLITLLRRRSLQVFLLFLELQDHQACVKTQTSMLARSYWTGTLAAGVFFWENELHMVNGHILKEVFWLTTAKKRYNRTNKTITP